MFFDLRKDDKVVVELWGLHLKGQFIHGNNILEIISEVSLITGRMKPLPAWSQQGAVIGLEGGSKGVENILQKLESTNDLPISAIWLQDWSGLRSVYEGDRLLWNWNMDTTYYSNWRSMRADLEKRNIKLMTYVNPLFSIDDATFDSSNRYNLVEEGERLGYYVKHKSGKSYVITSGTIKFKLLDVTNPDARVWMKQILKKNMIQESGAVGWMADFGEHLPLDAVLHSKEDAAKFHNQYPLEWAKINHEALEEYHLEHNMTSDSSDLLYFMRSASLKSPGHTSLFWLGDQCVSWDSFDGIKTIITAALTGGLAGHSLTHSDIGGYTMVSFYLLELTRIIISYHHLVSSSRIIMPKYT